MNNIDIIAEGVRAMSADINDQMREVPAIMEKLEKQLMFHYITGDVTVTPMAKSSFVVERGGEVGLYSSLYDLLFDLREWAKDEPGYDPDEELVDFDDNNVFEILDNYCLSVGAPVPTDRW